MTPDDRDETALAETQAAPETQSDHESGRATPLSLPPPGYEYGDVIGAGGMGEVVVAHDRRIGRRVAVKRMRSGTPNDDAVARFLREAMIQARLDHPAVAPVHEIGQDEHGRPYFTMKRLTGTTLAQTLALDASLQQLLRAFVDVCLAVDFAHSRKVVHRDLKPSNIMLGDFGEVYVLDWGIARVLGEVEDAGASGAIPTLDPERTLGGATQQGQLLGTPGYMAPEQAVGKEVGPAADVYALGAILFEILTGEALHPRGPLAFKTTLDPAPRATERTPDREIAPELDELCSAALALDPVQRPNARELADRVQRFLDGDRDLERRRVLAAEHLARAREAIRDPARRSDAIFESGRALVLDPTSADAAALVTKLTVELPAELPPELTERLEAVDTELARKQWAVVAVAFAVYYAFLPLVIWQGIKSWPQLALAYAFITIMVGIGLRNTRAARPWVTVPLVINAAGMVLFTRVFGPFIAVGFFAVVISGWLAYPTYVERPWRPLGVLLAALATPLVLEHAGVFTRVWAIEGDAIISGSTMFVLDGLPATIVVIASTFGTLMVAGLLSRRLAAERRQAQRKVEMQAWQLRKLLPA